MADYYSFEEFRSYFAMVVDKFLNEYLEGFNTTVILLFGLFLYLMFQNKRMMTEMSNGNQQLLSRLCIMELSNATMADEVKQVQHVNQQLLSKVCDVELSNTKMAKRMDTLEIGYKLSDKASSDENKKLVDYINYVNDEVQKIAGSVRSLEGLLHQDTQALEKSIVSKLQEWKPVVSKIQEWEPVISKIQEWEDRIAILEKGSDASCAQNSSGQPPMGYYGTGDTLPKVVKITGLPPSTPLLFPATIQSKIAPGGSSEFVEYSYEPVHMRDIKDFKEAISMHGVQSTYVKQLLNSWSAKNRILPTDWMQLTAAVLDQSQNLQWRSWFREEAKTLEQQGKIRGFFASQDQILGEGMFADVRTQSTYDEHTLLLCRTAALNAWEKILDPGQKIEHYTKVKQGLKEPYTDFIQRLTTAVNRAISDPEVRKQLILSLAFDNANLECRRMLIPLKIKGAPIEEWVQYAINAESLHCNEENWVGQAVTNVRVRNQGVTCFNCGKQGHIRRNCTQGTLGNNSRSRFNSNRRPLPSGLCRRCGKGRHWTNECRSTRDKEGNPLPSGNAFRGFPREAPKSQTPNSRMVKSYPVIVEDQHSQDE